MKTPNTFVITLPGPSLKRGFWLYVWRVKTPEGYKHYVGRTGDSSSPNASPAYIRMGQHLGRKKNTNALRKYLEAASINPETCTYEMIVHGPIYDEVHDGFDYNDKELKAVLLEKHKPFRDDVAAMEKQLCDDMRAAGYVVFNDVNCRIPLNLDNWEPVRAAFAKEFPKLLNANLLDCGRD